MKIMGLPCRASLAVALLLASAPGRGAEVQVAFAVAVKGAPTPAQNARKAQQAALKNAEGVRRALNVAFQAKGFRTSFSDPAQPVPVLGDEKARQGFAEQKGVRFVVDGSVEFGSPAGADKPGWIAELNLFDAETGKSLAVGKPCQCSGCTIDEFTGKTYLAPVLAGLAAQADTERRRPLIRLTLQLKPSTPARLRVDDRAPDKAPATWILPAGRHVVSADGGGLVRKRWPIDLTESDARPKTIVLKLVPAEVHVELEVPTQMPPTLIVRADKEMVYASPDGSPNRMWLIADLPYDLSVEVQEPCIYASVPARPVVITDGVIVVRVASTSCKRPFIADSDAQPPSSASVAGSGDLLVEPARVHLRVAATRETPAGFFVDHQMVAAIPIGGLLCAGEHEVKVQPDTDAFRCVDLKPVVCRGGSYEWTPAIEPISHPFRTAGIVVGGIGALPAGAAAYGFVVDDDPVCSGEGATRSCSAQRDTWQVASIYAGAAGLLVAAGASLGGYGRYRGPPPCRHDDAAVLRLVTGANEVSPESQPSSEGDRAVEAASTQARRGGHHAN